MNKNALLFIGLAVAVLVGLSLLLRPAQTPAPAAPVPSTSADAAASPAVPQPPKPQRFEIVVSKGRRVSGPEVIQVVEGDDVELQVTSDRADELHLHGYDLHLSLKPDQPGMLAFKAEHSGRFDYELHHAHLALGALEVQPK